MSPNRSLFALNGTQRDISQNEMPREKVVSKKLLRLQRKYTMNFCDKEGDL
jgi:hypothetical protein